jgi:hypothetical protein
MPEVQIEGDPFLETALRFNEEEQIPFPVFGDFIVTGV